jgi:hypothetical protein
MNARALALALAALGSTCAQAQVYESAHLGLGHARFSCDGTTDCKTNSMALRLTGGYVFYDRLAAEFGFINFGKASATLPDTGSGATDVDYKASAFTLGLAYQLPISGDWGASFRLGMAAVTGKRTNTNDGVKVELGNKTKTKPYWGFGGNYSLSSHVMLEANADFARAPRYQGQKLDLRTLTLGARYSF